jgi:hypothetical protein
VPEIRYVKIENLETHPEKKLNVGDLGSPTTARSRSPASAAA